MFIYIYVRSINIRKHIEHRKQLIRYTIKNNKSIFNETKNKIKY